MAKTVSRKVRFYRTLLYNGSGKLAEDQGAIFSELGRLPFRDEHGQQRLSPVTDKVHDAAKCWPAGQYSRGTWARTKFTDFPVLEDLDEVESGLDAQGKGLKHAVHWIWHNLGKLEIDSSEDASEPPRCGWLLWEVTRGVPNIHYFQSYLNQLFEGEYAIQMDPMLSPDPIERLERQGRLGTITLAVGRDGGQVWPGLLGLMNLIPKDTQTVEIVLRAGKRRHATEDVMELLDSVNTEGLSKGEISIPGEGPVNLIRDLREHIVKVPTIPDTQAVDHQEMFSQLGNLLRSQGPGVAEQFGYKWKVVRPTVRPPRAE